MKSKIRLLIIVFIVLAAGGGAWWYFHRPATDGVLTLYGNLDFRYASVPFNGNERIAEVLAEEGMVVKKGQLLARLDTNRLLPQLAQSEAAVETQKAVLERLLNGSRKEEIAQAKANLESAKADAVNASAQYKRHKVLGPIAAVSQQDIDQAKAAAEEKVDCRQCIKRSGPAQMRHQPGHQRKAHGQPERDAQRGHGVGFADLLRAKVIADKARFQ